MIKLFTLVTVLFYSKYLKISHPHGTVFPIFIKIPEMAKKRNSFHSFKVWGPSLKQREKKHPNLCPES